MFTCMRGWVVDYVSVKVSRLGRKPSHQLEVGRDEIDLLAASGKEKAYIILTHKFFTTHEHCGSITQRRDSR